MRRLAFKKDEYYHVRGKHSRRFDIYFRRCQTLIFTYQKDGP